MLERTRKDVLEVAGLEKLEKTLKEFVEGFDDLTGVQKRNAIEKIIKRVVVKPGNQIELQIYGEPPRLFVIEGGMSSLG